MMRPNVEHTRDPLRPEALPALAGLELDYRTNAWNSVSALRRITLVRILRASAFAAGLTVALRYLSAYSAGPYFLTLAVLITSCIALLHYLKNEPFATCGLWLSAGPAIWLLSVVDSAKLHLLLWAATLLLCAHLAHEITTHYAWWMRANPQLRRPVRIRWRRWWPRTPWWAPALQCLRPARARVHPEEMLPLEAEEAAHYPAGFAALLLAYLAAVSVYLLTPNALYAGMAAFVAFIGMLVAFGIYSLRQYDPNVSLASGLAVVRDAMISWYTYNGQATVAPGVFRSPCGSRLSRGLDAGVVIALTALTILPLAAFFPVAAIALGPQPWERAAQLPSVVPDWQRLGSTHSRPPRQAEPWDDALVRYLRRFPPQERQAVFDRLEAERKRQSDPHVNPIPL